MQSPPRSVGRVGPDLKEWKIWYSIDFKDVFN